MNWTRRILIALGLVLVVGAVAYGFWPEAQRVELATVTRGPLEVTVEEEARTRLSQRYVITAPVAGHVQRIALNEGDRIEPGQALCTLEPSRPDILDPRRHAEAEARVQAAQASLQMARDRADGAEADAVFARDELERVAALWQDAAATDQEYEQARTTARRSEAAWASAQSAVEAARYEEAAARTTLQVVAGRAPDATDERVTLSSPIRGAVMAVHHASEGPVQRGQPLLDVGDPEALDVVAEVLSSDAVQIETGMPVRLERWGGPKALQGRVRVVEPQGFTKISALGVEEQRVRVVIDIISDREAWRALGDGYRLVAHVIVWASEDVLTVPTSALFRVDGGWAVFVADGGQARRRTVTPGRRAGLTTQVVDGLTAGEAVIVHPDDALEDGVRIRPWDER